MKRIFGILIFIVGVVLICYAQYIKKQVAEGTLKVSSAKQSVETGKGLFSMTPVTKEVGNLVTGSAEKKIAAGQEQIDYYSSLANKMQIGGIVLVIVGAGMVILFWRRRR